MHEEAYIFIYLIYKCYVINNYGRPPTIIHVSFFLIGYMNNLKEEKRKDIDTKL